jgi:uncharacterized protein YbjQ (UPF0145 family)
MERLKIGHPAAGKGAATAGAREGDIIESYAGITISSNNDLSAAIEKVGPAVMLVHRGKELVRIEVAALPLGITATAIDYLPETGETIQIGAADEKQRRLEDFKVSQILATTTPFVDGRTVEKYIDVVTSECVFGMSVFADIFTSLSDFFGGRSGTSQDTLRRARETCLYELRKEALRLGANAVIGINLDYSELSGQGKSMLFLVASGTAVVLTDPITKQP